LSPDSNPLPRPRRQRNSGFVQPTVSPGGLSTPTSSCGGSSLVFATFTGTPWSVAPSSGDSQHSACHGEDRCMWRTSEVVVSVLLQTPSRYGLQAAQSS
jgi:hypothetical protein